MSHVKEDEQPALMGGSDQRLGIILVERCMLRALETLWKGPVDVANLNRIERSLRAFLVAETLVASRVSGDPWQLPTNAELSASTSDLRDDEEPFDDHLLDYEFVSPGNAHPYSEIDPYESQYLRAQVLSEVRTAAEAALPSWIEKNGQAMAYLDAWYAGSSEQLCETRARVMGNWGRDSDDWAPFDRNYILSHAVFHLGPVTHANYLLGCHRAGIAVCGDTPVAKICTDHVFSRWPDHLFERFGAEFERTAREIRGPGLGVTLPAVVSLVLSRARNRNDIPRTIVTLREEYADSRRKLWILLREMWTCASFEHQISILRKLDLASASMYEVAFGPGFDALSLGIAATQSVLSLSPADLMSNMRDQDRPKARVSAVSFMIKLAGDMRKDLLNQRSILRRHFTDAELREFGSAR